MSASFLDVVVNGCGGCRIHGGRAMVAHVRARFLPVGRKTGSCLLSVKTDVIDKAVVVDGLVVCSRKQTISELTDC